MTSTQACDSAYTFSKRDLDQFTGDMIRYVHPLNPKVIYTPGVQYLAENAKAYWLIDAIASYFGSQQMNAAIDFDCRIGALHFWRLTVTGDTGLLTAVADDGEQPFISQKIHYTDFPFDSIDIWAGQSASLWTLYLPSEH